MIRVLEIGGRGLYNGIEVNIYLVRKKQKAFLRVIIFSIYHLLYKNLWKNTTFPYFFGLMHHTTHEIFENPYDFLQLGFFQWKISGVFWRRVSLRGWVTGAVASFSSQVGRSILLFLATLRLGCTLSHSDFFCEMGRVDTQETCKTGCIYIYMVFTYIYIYGIYIYGIYIYWL